jgi:hypothetical protein
MGNYFKKIVRGKIWFTHGNLMLLSLMKYMAPEPRKTIVLDMDDMIQQRKLIEFGPDAK